MSTDETATNNRSVEAVDKAGDVQASEQRVHELDRQIRESEIRLMRNSIAERIGLSPDDRDLLLTGTDADSLEAQATFLVQRGFGRPPGNIAPREGQAISEPRRRNEDMREFANDLFGNDDW